MNWKETYDALCDIQTLLFEMANAIEKAHESAHCEILTNVIFACECDELLTSIGELIDVYKCSEYRNTYLSSKLRHFVSDIRESIATLSRHDFRARYTLGNRIGYSIYILSGSIEIDKNKLHQVFGR